MKIKFALVSSDSNPFYLDFWPLVSKHWKSRFSITPILCYVGTDDLDISEEFGRVVRYEPVDGIPVSFQAQWARFFHAKECGEDVAIISDIDMLPLSKYYFIDQIKEVPERQYVHLNPCIESYGHLPACYHVAAGKLFKEVLEINESWPDSCRFVYSQKLGEAITLPQIGEPIHWFTDEMYTHKKVLAYPDQSVFLFLPREGGQNGRRIDRLAWRYDGDLLRQGYYYDAHCIRPYAKYRRLIDPLINDKPLPYWYEAQVNVRRSIQRGKRLFGKLIARNAA